MNQTIKVLLLCGLLISLTACNQAITRFWNNDGWYPSPAKEKAYDECFQEYKKINPPPIPPVHEDMSSEESRKRRAEAGNWILKCVQKKTNSK